MFSIAGAFIGGVATSLLSGDDSSDYYDAAASGADTQSIISSSMWNNYLATFQPLNEELVSTVTQPLEQQPGTKQALATVDRGYADATGNLKRDLGGRYQYGSGTETGNLLNLETQRTQAKATTYANAGQKQLSNQLQVANIGIGQPAQAATAAGNAASIYGSLATAAGNAAQSSWDSVGNGIGNLMQLYTLTSGSGS